MPVGNLVRPKLRVLCLLLGFFVCLALLCRRGEWLHIPAQAEQNVEAIANLESGARLNPSEIVDLFVTLGDPPDRRVEAWRAAGLKLYEAARRDEGLDLHRLGVYLLLDGKTDAAIEKLKAAKNLSPSIAIETDLMAAWIERSQSRRFPLDLVRAAAMGLERQGKRSDELDTNTALALEGLGLHRSARLLYENLVESEQHQNWKSELSKRLSEASLPSAEEVWPTIREPLISSISSGDLDSASQLTSRAAAAAREDPLRARLLAEEALGRWALELDRQDTQAAARWLALARSLGNALAGQTEDTLLLETVERIDAQDESSIARAEIAEAFRQFARGTDLLARNDTRSARTYFETAGRSMASSQIPFELRAKFFEAFCAYHESTAEGIEHLREIQRRLESGRFPYLAGRVEWVLGSGEKTQGHLQAALDHYNKAEQLLSRSAGPAESEFIGILVAETLQLAGETEGSWRTRIAAMHRVSRFAQPERETAMYFEAATALAAIDAGPVALAALAELRMAAEETQKPYWLATAEVYSGLTLVELGQQAAGLEHLERAQIYLSQIPIGPQRGSLEARANLFQGLALSQEDPARSLELLNSSLDRETQAGQGFFRIPALRARGRAKLALRRNAEALSDLLATVQDFEHDREEFADWKTQRAASHSAQEAAESILENEALTAVLSIPQRFTLADNLRAWAQGGIHLPRQALQVDPKEIEDSLEPSTAMLHFTVMPHEVLVWILRHGKSQEISLPIGRSELLQKLGQLESAFEASADRNIKSQLASLYGQLIGPLEPLLVGIDKVILVPDAILSSLPFPALIEPRQSHYWIEDVQISWVPSAALWLSHRRARQGPRRTHQLPPLLVGVGKPGHGLSNLSGVSEEIERIQRLFPNNETLLAENATPAQVRAKLRNRSLVHFASHALVDSKNPGRSKLVLTGETLDSASLTIEDSVANGLAEADLIVLAGCSTLDHDLGDRDIVLGAAGFLYGAGAHAVLAARRQLDDDFAAEIMPQFLSTYQLQGDAAAAWQATVGKFLATGRLRIRSPTVWGHLAVVGDFGDTVRSP